MLNRSFALLISLPLLVTGCGDDSDSNADASSSAGDMADDTDGGTMADEGGDGDAETSGTGESGDGDGDGDPMYPAEPWGINVGDTFGKYIWFRGDGSEFHTETLFNIEQRAIVIYGTAAWCGTCRAEVEEMTPVFASDSGNIMPIGVLFEDNFGQVPTADVATGYNAPGTTFEFFADVNPDFDVIFPDSNLIPRVLVIDSRDMTISYKMEGHDKEGLYAAVAELLEGP
jgi:hypothetical protein